MLIIFGAKLVVFLKVQCGKKAVRVEFPDCKRNSGGTYTRVLVDSGSLESIELSSDTADDTLSRGELIN